MTSTNNSVLEIGWRFLSGILSSCMHAYVASLWHRCRATEYQFLSSQGCSASWTYNFLVDKSKSTRMHYFINPYSTMDRVLLKALERTNAFSNHRHTTAMNPKFGGKGNPRVEIFKFGIYLTSTFSAAQAIHKALREDHVIKIMSHTLCMFILWHNMVSVKLLTATFSLPFYTLSIAVPVIASVFYNAPENMSRILKMVRNQYVNFVI